MAQAGTSGLSQPQAQAQAQASSAPASSAGEASGSRTQGDAEAPPPPYASIDLGATAAAPGMYGIKGLLFGDLGDYSLFCLYSLKRQSFVASTLFLRSVDTFFLQQQQDQISATGETLLMSHC